MRLNLLKLSSFLSALLFSSLLQATELDLAKDLKALGESNPKEVIVLMVSRPDCGYCTRVKNDFLGPLLKTDNAPPVRVIRLDTMNEMVGFDGKSHTAEEIAESFNARFTPTILFVNHQGEVLHDPLIGLSTPDFYGYYLDEAIRLSRAQLNP